MANARCVQEVFDFREFFNLYVYNFDFIKCKINIGVIQVSLNLDVFILLFKLPQPNKNLELPIVNSFLEAEGCGIDIVWEFISTSYEITCHLSLVDISFFRQSFRYLYWLFTHVVGLKRYITHPKIHFLYTLWDIHK